MNARSEAQEPPPTAPKAMQRVLWLSRGVIPPELDRLARHVGIVLSPRTDADWPAARMAWLPKLDVPDRDAITLTGRRIAILEPDAGRADAIAEAVRARGAAAVSVGLSEEGLARVEALEPEVLLVSPKNLVTAARAQLGRIWAHPTLRWTPVLVVPDERLGPAGSRAPDVAELSLAVSMLCADYIVLVRRAQRDGEFSVPLAQLGPSRILRGLIEAQRRVRATFRGEGLVIEVDVSDGIVVGARGGVVRPDEDALLGVHALSVLFSQESGSISVREVQHPAVTNVMAPLDASLLQSHETPAMVTSPPRGANQGALPPVVMAHLPKEANLPSPPRAPRDAGEGLDALEASVIQVPRGRDAAPLGAAPDNENMRPRGRLFSPFQPAATAERRKAPVPKAAHPVALVEPTRPVEAMKLRVPADAPSGRLPKTTLTYEESAEREEQERGQGDEAQHEPGIIARAGVQVASFDGLLMGASLAGVNVRRSGDPSKEGEARSPASELEAEHAPPVESRARGTELADEEDALQARGSASTPVAAAASLPASHPAGNHQQARALEAEESGPQALPEQARARAPAQGQPRPQVASEPSVILDPTFGDQLEETMSGFGTLEHLPLQRARSRRGLWASLVVLVLGIAAGGAVAAGRLSRKAAPAPDPLASAQVAAAPAPELDLEVDRSPSPGPSEPASSPSAGVAAPAAPALPPTEPAADLAPTGGAEGTRPPVDEVTEPKAVPSPAHAASDEGRAVAEAPATDDAQASAASAKTAQAATDAPAAPKSAAPLGTQEEPPASAAIPASAMELSAKPPAQPEVAMLQDVFQQGSRASSSGNGSPSDWNRAEVDDEAARRADEVVLRAHAMRREGRMDAARATYIEALHIVPSYPRALAGIAETYLAQKNKERALDAVKRLIEHRPQFPDDHRLLGDVYVMMGRIEDARAAYQNASRMGSRVARERLKELPQGEAQGNEGETAP